VPDTEPEDYAARMVAAVERRFGEQVTSPTQAARKRDNVGHEAISGIMLAHTQSIPEFGLSGFVGAAARICLLDSARVRARGMPVA